MTQQKRYFTHDEQHQHVAEMAEGWGEDDFPLVARLLVHLGSHHGWQPPHVANTGPTPLLAWHDVFHGTDDTLGVEHTLPAQVVTAIGRERRRLLEQD